MSERSVRAVSLLRELNALDSHGNLRSELELAGVPNHQIEALYPHTFDSLIEGLLEHLRPHDVSYLTKLNGRMDERIATKSNAIFSLPDNLLDRWKQLDKNPREGAGRTELHEFLRGQLGGHYTAYVVADNFYGLMLRTWWLATHRADLPQHLQVNSDLNVVWMGSNLLPHLGNLEAP